MRILFLDCSSGISGDMTVGALCDLGVNPSTFEWELSKLDIGDFHMHFDRQERQGISGIRFGIHEGSTHTHECEEHEAHGHEHEHGHAHEHKHDGHCCHGHAHSHEEHQHHDEHDKHAHAHQHEEHCCHGHSHGEHHHHHEEPSHEHEHEHEHHDGCCHGHSHGEHDHGHAHGRSYEEIRALIEQSELSEFVKKHALSIFHRIAVAEGHVQGALNVIADVICVCVGLESLKIEAVHVSPIQADEAYESITPTGAAIVAEFGTSFGAMPPMRVEKTGYGIGAHSHASRTNVLRAVVGVGEGGEAV